MRIAAGLLPQFAFVYQSGNHDAVLTFPLRNPMMGRRTI